MKNPFKAFKERAAKKSAEELDLEKRKLLAEIKIKEDRVRQMMDDAATKSEIEQIEVVKRIKVLKNDIEGLKASFFNITKMQTVEATYSNLDRASKLDAKTKKTLEDLLNVRSPGEFAERYDQLMAGREQYRAKLDAYETTVATREGAKPYLTPEEEADLKDIQYKAKAKERAKEAEIDATVKANLAPDEKALLAEIQAAAPPKKKE